jgi:PAS domain S-box-containing protein
VTHKIMVVDDNSATRRMVRNALQRNGHDVIEAADGATARELMRTEHPRVVLQDLMLPDTDGFKLVGELRSIARGTDVSILAFSGFVSELDEARVSTVGFDDIIPKPIAPSRLVPLIEAHLPSDRPAVGQFGGGRRIVIADDDPRQLKLAQFKLTRLGFDVEAVPDGRAALEAIRRRLPDAVVSDVMMPELDGFDLAMAVRQDPALAKLPLLLVTSSYVEPEDRKLAQRAGASDLVPRTPELSELLDALRTMISTSHVPEVNPEALPELERQHNQRVFRQLERQVMLNSGLAKRCSALASELTVLTGISEAVLKHRDVDVALDEVVAECFDAAGISFGAIFLLDDSGAMRVRQIGSAHDIPDNVPTLFGHDQLLREHIANHTTLEVPSGNGSALERELLDRANASALLLVPLVHLERSLGSLLMVTRGRELDRGDWRTFAHGVATQISHVLVLARAYADRELAEQRATAHAALLDAVFESAPDYVMQLDLEGKILMVNRSLAPDQPEELVGRNIFDFPAGDHGRMLRAALTRLVETGEPQGFEASLFRDDKQIWYSTRLGPIKQQGKVIGAVLVSRDVSENKQTEMHLMVADRMASVGTLAAGVAHEINNPLASVIANLDMAIHDVMAIVDRRGLPAELSEELDDARVAADRVREIVRDLKIFSRAEEERHGPVDVEHVLESTIRMAKNELRHRARLTIEFAKVPMVDANESRLGQVFLNVIINAAHAIPPGNYESNQITVKTATDGSRVQISVSDTGSGIPPEVRPRLFTPFFTTKPVGVGTGLGLAISHRIVTQYGGTIWFDTEVGRGTEFHISLPVALQAAPPPPRTKSDRVKPLRRGTVLVIDDEEPLAQAIRRFLSTDHEVTAVNGAREALDLLSAGKRYDVVLCDVMMPQVTGMDLYGDVKRMDPAQATRIVFLTGGAFTASAREFLDRVPNRRLEKPFDLKELRRLVNELVR